MVSAESTEAWRSVRVVSFVVMGIASHRWWAGSRGCVKEVWGVRCGNEKLWKRDRREASGMSAEGVEGVEGVEDSGAGGLEEAVGAAVADEAAREAAAVARLAGLLGSRVQRVAVPRLSRAELVERIVDWAAERLATEVNGEGRTTMKELVGSYRDWQLGVHGTTKTPPWGERSLRVVLLETLEAAGAEYVESGRYFRGLVLR